jgi:hypothetical protein
VRRHVVVVLTALAACSAPRVSSTEHEVVYTSAVSLDFGLVPINTTPAPLDIVVGVNMTTNEFHTIASITESCDDFSLDLTTLDDPPEIWRTCEACPSCAQGASLVCTSQTQFFRVSFTPTIPGPQSCTIDIDYGEGIETVTVNGTGEQAPYDLNVLTPIAGDLSFGDVIVGQTSSMLPITLRNDGTLPVEISAAALTGGGTVNYTISNGGAATVQPGATHTVQIQCAPQAAGPADDTFRFDSNDPESPLDIALSCTGIVSTLAINPSPARFADTFVGDSVDLPLTLLNTGGAEIIVDSISVTPSQFSVGSLPSNSIPVMTSQPLTVTFSPDAAVGDSDLSGTLTVNFNGSETRTIELVGPARTAMLSINPGGELDFGTICGGQSKRQLFAAVNLGSGSFDIASASLTGDGFSLSLEPASYPVPMSPRAGNTVAFEVTAAPPTGTAMGELTLVPSIASAPPAVVALTATGQAGGVAANPILIEIDSVLVGESSGGRSVRLTNCQPTPLSVTGVSIFGRNAAEFSAVSNLSVPGSIDPYSSVEWLVELRPTTEGEKAASLQITHGAGISTISLTGYGDDGIDEEGRGSYYACDAGGASGLALLALVILLLWLAPRRQRS